MDKKEYEKATNRERMTQEIKKRDVEAIKKAIHGALTGDKICKYAKVDTSQVGRNEHGFEVRGFYVVAIPGNSGALTFDGESKLEEVVSIISSKTSLLWPEDWTEAFSELSTVAIRVSGKAAVFFEAPGATIKVFTSGSIIDEYVE